MKTRTWWSIIVALLIIIIALLVLLIVTPAPATLGSGTATTTGTTPATSTIGGPAPLHERVVVNTPVSGAKVGKTFSVTGEAPGNWYFEATFPVQVRDSDNNKVGQGLAQAQSDWMTTEQVRFIAEVTVTGYTGPATLVLLRDNPSGLPESEDSLSIPVVIQ